MAMAKNQRGDAAFARFPAMEKTRPDTPVHLVHRTDVASPPPRALPANEAAEQALLGALLVNNEAIDRISDLLKPEHFHYAGHPQIFGACLRLRDQQRTADAVKLTT